MRVRKVTERSSGGKASERLYFGGFELYRKFDPKGAVELERSSLHVMDGERRAALIETKTVDRTKAHRAPVPVIRYQFSDHLDSAALELDDEAAVISYEEYFPYGSTSYQAERFVAEASVKRYRYAAKERDEETGFTYHGARYYAPLLGRWTSADPAGAGGGNNLFLYCGGNPTSRTDVNGSEWCGLTDGFFGLVDSDCHIAPEITRPVKRAAGGAYGALSNFGGFLRLGLWDSWAQSFSSSSEKRIQGAQKSMGEMFDAIGDGRFTDYVADGLSKRGEAIVAAEDKGDYFGSGEVFGDTAMTVYFAGRGGVDMVRGGVGLVTSISEDGVAATLRSTAYGARYWATEFEGVGLRSTPSVSINAARGSIIDNYPTFRAARVIARETALAERTLANGGATNMRSVQAWTRSIGTRWEPARYGSAVNRVVDNAIDANDLGVGVQQRLGTNAKGNPMYPDYQLTAEGNTAVIDITTPGQAGKALNYPANTALEPLTGTSAPGSSISVYLPVALESPAAADLFDLTDEEIRAQACFVH
jgi:RHS repeat-associated protein